MGHRFKLINKRIIKQQYREMRIKTASNGEARNGVSASQKNDGFVMPACIMRS